MQIYLQYKYYITVTKTGDGTPYLSHGYVLLRFRGNVIMKMGTQQQHNNQDRYVNELVPPRTWTTGFSLVYYLKNLDTNYSFLYLLSLIMCERVEKIIARTLCFTHQRIFRPIYIFNNYAYFLDFRAKKFPLIFLHLNPF